MGFLRAEVVGPEFETVLVGRVLGYEGLRVKGFVVLHRALHPDGVRFPARVVLF